MSWMSQLGWKEGLSPSALGEIDKLELEIQRLSKEKSIKSLQFETLEAALDKKERRIEEQKSLSTDLQRDLQGLNEELTELRSRYEKTTQDVSFKESQLSALKGSLDSKGKALDELQIQLRSLEDSKELLNSPHSLRLPAEIIGSPAQGGKSKDSDSSMESLRIKLENAEEVIRKKETMIRELRRESGDRLSVSTLDLFTSPKATRSPSCSAIFSNEEVNETKSNESLLTDPCQLLQEAHLRISELQTLNQENECKLFNLESLKASLKTTIKENEDSEIQKREKLLEDLETEKKSLLARIEELSKNEDNASVKEHAETLWKESLAEKEAQISRLEGLLNTSVRREDELKPLEEKVQSLSADNTKFQNENASLKKECCQLKENSENQLQDIRKHYEERLSEATKDSNAQKNISDELRNQLASLSESLESHKREESLVLAKKEEEVKCLMSRIEEMEKDEETESQRRETGLEALRENLREEKSKELAICEASWTEKIKVAENDSLAGLQDLQESLESKESELNILQTQIEAITAQKESLDIKIEELNSILESTSVNLKEREISLGNEIQALQMSLEESKKSLAEKISLNERISQENITLKDRTDALSNQCIAFETELTALKDELSFLKENTLPNLEESLLKAEERMAEMSNEEEEVVARTPEKNANLLIHTEEGLRQDLSEAQESLSIKESELIDLRSRLTGFEEALEIEKSDKLDLSDKLNEKLRDMLILQENCNLQVLTLEEDKSELEKRIENMGEMSSSLEEGSFNLRIQNEELQNSLKDTENKMASALKEKNDEHSQTVEALQNEKDKLSSELERLESDREKTLLHLDSLKDELALKNEEFDEKITDLSTKIASLEDSLEIKESQAFEAKEALDRAVNLHKDQLINLKGENDLQVRDLDAQVRRLSESIESLEREKRGYVEKIDALRLESISVSDSINKSNHELSQLRSEYETSLEMAEEEKKALREEIATSQSLIKSLKTDYETLNREVESLRPLEEEMRSAQDQITQKDTQLQEAQSNIQRVESEYKSLQSQLASLEETSKTTEAKIFKLEEDLKDSSLRTKELISENGDLNEQILDFESKYDALDEEVNECRDAKDKREREICELREESAAKLEAATNSFNMEKSELLSNISASQKELKDLKEKIRALEADKNKAITDLEASSTSLMEANASLDTANHAIASLESQLKEKTSEHTDVLKEKDSLKSQILESESALASLIAKEKKLQESLEDFKTQLASLSVVQVENEGLKKSLSGLEEGASELKSRIEALDAEKAELQRIHKKATEQMNAENEKIMEKLRSLEVSKEDDSRSWKSKVKSLLDSLKRKEKDILSLQTSLDDLKTSLKTAKAEEEKDLPWESSASAQEDYKDFSPLDLLYVFKEDPELSHRAKWILYSGAFHHLQADLESKMDRNIQLVKELGEAKTIIDRLKFKYEELPKMNIHTNTKMMGSSSSSGMSTRSSSGSNKRKTMMDSENASSSSSPALKNDTGLSNPFKKRNLLKPATLKNTNPRPLSTITNQTKTRSDSK